MALTPPRVLHVALEMATDIKLSNAEIGNFFSRVLPALIDQMEGQFPALRKQETDLKEILDEEEAAFAKTLDRGEAQFEKFAAAAQKKGGKLSGVRTTTTTACRFWHICQYCYCAQ